jgi:hypothetical protein
MKQLFTFLLFAVPMGMAAQQNCANALTAVSGVTYNVSFAPGSQVPPTICAEGQNNPENIDHGAWYTYTPDALVTAVVSTTPASVDTRVHIYKGSCSNLSCVGGDDDSGPDYSAQASFMAEAGVTYYIVFDDNWTEDSFSFTIAEETFIAPLFVPQYITIEGGKNCVVDMNGDYLDDIVAPDYDWQDPTGAINVRVLYQSANSSGFTPQTLTMPNTIYRPDWSIAAGDYDNNGYNDLLFGNGGGAAIVLQNNTGTAFSTTMESPEYVFSQRTNFVDIDADGNLDAFVCHDLAPNVYFMNNGNGGFDYGQGGLGDWPSGGNYGSIWIDFDNDGDMDLFIAKCRGGGDEAALDELHRNNGDGTFTNIAAELGFANLHQAWSAVWQDFDNDGDLDVLIGSSAGAYGEFDPNNPLHAHKLYRHDGNVFTEVTAGSGYDTFTTPSLEHVAHDFNNDGYIDVLGGGNTIMYNNGNFTFSPVAIPAGSGPIGDLNNDGFLDIVNGNIVYFNYANDNNWIKVHLKGVESNRSGIGARIEVYTTATGLEKQIREIRSGDGFGYMSSLNAHFGLGTAEAITKVVVKWPSGTVDTILNPAINTPLLVVEGETVMGTTPLETTQLTLYPNPVKDVITISGVEAASATIYDLNGRLVQQAEINSSRIPVQQLAKGTYILRIKDAQGKAHSAKFIKG